MNIQICMHDYFVILCVTINIGKKNFSAPGALVPREPKIFSQFVSLLCRQSHLFFFLIVYCDCFFFFLSFFGCVVIAHHAYSSMCRQSRLILLPPETKDAKEDPCPQITHVSVFMGRNHHTIVFTNHNLGTNLPCILDPGVEANIIQIK